MRRLSDRPMSSGERSRRQRERERDELARLRAFVQWVADTSTEPEVRAEAIRMGVG
jgi:hypothetical protein